MHTCSLTHPHSLSHIFSLTRPLCLTLSLSFSLSLSLTHTHTHTNTHKCFHIRVCERCEYLDVYVYVYVYVYIQRGVAVCCSVLQSVAVCCSVLQCVAVLAIYTIGARVSSLLANTMGAASDTFMCIHIFVYIYIDLFIYKYILICIDLLKHIYSC